ncbi:hypothetical protein Q7P35_002827 [Cladosporium inversicolor]
MCNNRTISEPNRLEAVIQFLHIANQVRNEPIDLYHLHDYFTVSPDEPEDDVADANENVGIEFGYGRPNLGEFEFEDEEFGVAMQEFLEEVWPVDRSLRVNDEESEEIGEDERICEDEDGADDEGEAEGEDKQRVDGDETTNTDTTTTAEEDDTQTNVDTLIAPAAEGEPPTQRVPGSITTDNAVSRAPGARNNSTGSPSSCRKKKKERKTLFK